MPSLVLRERTQTVYPKLACAIAGQLFENPAPKRGAVTIGPDVHGGLPGAAEPHIVVDSAVCRHCSIRECVHACPANLFVPREDGGRFNYGQCFECSTCYMVCNREGAITWRYPEGGFGCVPPVVSARRSRIGRAEVAAASARGRSPHGRGHARRALHGLLRGRPRGARVGLAPGRDLGGRGRGRLRGTRGADAMRDALASGAARAVRCELRAGHLEVERVDAGSKARDGAPARGCRGRTGCGTRARPAGPPSCQRVNASSS